MSCSVQKPSGVDAGRSELKELHPFFKYSVFRKLLSAAIVAINGLSPDSFSNFFAGVFFIT